METRGKLRLGHRRALDRVGLAHLDGSYIIIGILAVGAVLAFFFAR